MRSRHVGHPDGRARCARCARELRVSGDGTPRRRVETGERIVTVASIWPEGPICPGCKAAALEVFGICDGCGQDRMLPGRGPAGQRWCTDCAGGLGDFTCTRCGREGWRGRRDTCGWCVLSDRLTELLDDGTGQVRPELRPLAEHIVAMARPRSGIHWLSRPGPRQILRALAHAQVPLTHEAIHTLHPVRSSIYIRDLMVAAAILPPVDRRLFLFEQWWPTWLAQIPDPDHRTTLRAFLTWHVLRSMRAAAADGPVSQQRSQQARHILRISAQFLADLAAHDRALDTCTQADLDRAFASANLSMRATLRPFLQWAMRTNRMPTLRLPPHVERPIQLITQDQRVALLRRIHQDQQMEPIDRVLALLVLLYAQPLARIQQLTLDDVTHDATAQMLVRIGDPPSPVPPPFDAVIRDYLTKRSNVMTATNPASRWLFPGRRAGQPLQINSMRLRLTNLGIPNLPSRTRAIRELLRQAPPAIVAGMLHYTDSAAERIATETGATWKHYPQSDRQPRREPHLGR